MITRDLRSRRRPPSANVPSARPPRPCSRAACRRRRPLSSRTPTPRPTRPAPTAAALLGSGDRRRRAAGERRGQVLRIVLADQRRRGAGTGTALVADRLPPVRRRLGGWRPRPPRRRWTPSRSPPCWPARPPGRAAARPTPTAPTWSPGSPTRCAAPPLFLDRAPGQARAHREAPTPSCAPSRPWCFGHPLHPAPKSRDGTRPTPRASRYSPEPRGAFPLHWMAVDRSAAGHRLRRGPRAAARSPPTG